MTTDNNSFTVQRSADIAAPPARIFSELEDFHRWINWSPWEGLDPELRRTYSGPDQGVGAAYAWEGNRKVGSGRMEITDATSPDSLVLDLQFLKPFKAHNTTRFELAATDAGTHVTWTMTGPKTLLSKVMGIFMSMDKMVGRDFEKGLAQLKAVVES